ncbi:MAG: AraC family transcriptional regulator [Deltaproteobacteria bacterium]|nr:AraC family transcriptional regulator [Deltaproteobacteria bacterium]
MSEGAVRHEGTISTRVVVRIVDFVARRGHDAEALCRSAGVALSTLRDADARVPYALADRLGERAVEVTGDANLGLHLAGDVQDTGIFDAGLLMLMASASVRVALERMERHQRYWGDGQRCTLIPIRGGVSIRYFLDGASALARRHADECALAEMVIGVRFLSGAHIAPRVVRFRHAEPRDTREHTSLFGAPLEFDAAHTELVLDDDVLDLELRHANEAYCAIFREQVERVLASLPSPGRLSDEVRAAAHAALTAGDCTVEGTARALGLSTRTLQRRLREEGTSFSALVDALRRELALEHVGRGTSIPEIAWLLGYADATAFQHAFRRWTGTTPERMRAERLDASRAPKR